MARMTWGNPNHPMHHGPAKGFQLPPHVGPLSRKRTHKFMLMKQKAKAFAKFGTDGYMWLYDKTCYRREINEYNNPNSFTLQDEPPEDIVAKLENAYLCG